MTSVFARTGHPYTITRVGTLILYVSASISEIARLGQVFRWPRLRRCIRCGGNRLWSHGYVDRYFGGLERPVPVKRWRCPDCRTVYTMRPGGFWRGFWAAEQDIRESLRQKLVHGRWLPGFGRQRQQYWWRGFKRQLVFEGLWRSPHWLFEQPLILATHSLTHRELRPLPPPLHLIFAFSPPSGGP